MQYEILHKGAFPLLQVKMSPGESIKAESGAMVSMTPNIDLRGSVEGGILKGIGRMLGGEKFFFQELTAQNRDGEVTLAPTSLGDIVAVELDGSYSLYVQKDGFLAATRGIEVSTKMQNLAKGFLSGEGFFIIEISGRGTVFLSSFGAIETKQVRAGEELIVDNGHLVAWSSNMSYQIERASKGWVSTFTSGEVAVCRFRGPGTIMIQTRNPRSIGVWLGQFVPKS
ncbi:TIGR00266 family protein [Paenibacillus marinisediminis]